MIEINAQSVSTGVWMYDTALTGVLKKRTVTPELFLTDLLRRVESEYNLAGLLAVNFYRAGVPKHQRGEHATTIEGESVILGTIHPASEGVHHKIAGTHYAVINIGYGLSRKDAEHSLLHELAHHLAPSGGDHPLYWMVKNLELQQRYADIEYSQKREAVYLNQALVSSAMMQLIGK